MLGRILGVIGIPLLITGLIGLGAIIYFQQTGTDVSAADILVWFGLLPVGTVAVWFVSKMLLARRQRLVKGAANAKTTPSAPAAEEKDARLSLQLAVLSAEINTAAGDSPAYLVRAIREGTVRPALSARLFDGEGLPVKASVHTELLVDEYLPWVEHWLRTSGRSDLGSIADGARLLALMHAPLKRVVDVLAELPSGIDANTVPSRADKPALRPLVTKVFAPHEWQEMITAYVRAEVAKIGGFAFGIVRTDAERSELQLDAVRVADAFCKASSDIYSHSILMIVSCDSLTAQDRVDALEMQGLLFTSSHQVGIVPGEAAAIILAAPPVLVDGETSPLASLHRAAFGNREKPVNAGSRIDPAFLQQLTGMALANAATETSEIGALVSDCDHRSAWFSESAMLVSQTFAELDPIADHLAVGNALGSTGHANSALALALASHAIRIDKKPLLAASLTDAQARSIVALRPWQALPECSATTANLS
jgi:hypothetical protein